MDNHTYNLLQALSKKGKSVWAYEVYIKDSDNCPECKDLWKKLKKEDSRMIEEIKKVLVDHVKGQKIK